MNQVIDIHTRRFVADGDTIGAKLETLASADDDFWVTDLTPAMILDRGLQPGSRGGHGAVRYSVIEHTPGRSVAFEFDPATGLTGTHRFKVASHDHEVEVTHELRAHVSGAMRMLWRPLVLPLHSGVIEDIFDHLERSATGEAHRHRRTSPWLRRLARGVSAIETAVSPGSVG